jgi:uncharacterized protein YggE
MIRPFVLVFLAAVAMTAAAPTAFAREAERPGTLEVTGQATVRVEANLAVIEFGVETHAGRAADAVRKNAELTTKLVKALQEGFGKRDALHTSGYSLSPTFERGDRSQPAGYRVQNRVIVETHQLESIGKMIDAAATAGGTTINSLRFSHDALEQYRHQARIAAIAQACKNAPQLAEAAGLKIRRVVRIGDASEARPVRYALESAAAASPTPIFAGEISAEASVLVVFELE